MDQIFTRSTLEESCAGVPFKFELRLKPPLQALASVDVASATGRGCEVAGAVTAIVMQGATLQILPKLGRRPGSIAKTEELNFSWANLLEPKWLRSTARLSPIHHP